MRPLGHVDRRTAVEAYVAYDAAKKSKPFPDITSWDWTSADAIDDALRAAGFKAGVPAGFTDWDHVELTVEDLRRCAVVGTISRDLQATARDLAALERDGKLASWKPRSPEPSWLSSIEAGDPQSLDHPLLLRPATSSERPAEWYLEDGSGRATAIVANAHRYARDVVVATGYLGVTVDQLSTFMQRRFAELLRLGRSS